MVFGISFLFCFVTLNFVSGIMINEVELNPNDECNDCKEWLELYSQEPVNLINWIIIDKDNNKFYFNASFSGYYVLENISISLNNANEQLFLYNLTEIISQTPIISDSQNNDKTWQYCRGNWSFINSTKRQENLCQTETEQNQTQEDIEEENQEGNTKNITLELKWDEEDIINGEEFDIEVTANNLEQGDYDIKLYITEKENDTIISETYHEEENDWRSSTYYIEKAISGSGEESGTFTLRINEKYKDFDDNTKINIRIRKSGSSNYLVEEIKNIDLIPRGENASNEEVILQKEEIEEERVVLENQETSVIRLGNKKSEVIDKSKNGNLLYESTNEKIKKYSIYAFCIFLIGVIIFLIKKKF